MYLKFINQKVYINMATYGIIKTSAQQRTQYFAIWNEIDKKKIIYTYTWLPT